MIEDVTIPSGSYQLQGRLHRPQDPPRAAYVLHPAVGVPRAYYDPFAAWVAKQGFAILIYDYRSDGAGLAALKQSKIRLADWGITDQAAALRWLADTFETCELRVIGHSLGGFMTMFHNRAADISRLSAVCSGPAFWRRTPGKKKLGTFAFWYLLGPAATRVLGYMPARLLGGSVHVPANAYWQWRRWCTNTAFHKPDWGTTLPQPDLDAFGGDLNLVAVEDDWMIAPPVVWDLAQFYPRAKVSFTEVPARDGPIGHTSIFRPRNKVHWPELL